nr:uncharacterized protein LOC109150211 [Ipomoea trifida]
MIIKLLNDDHSPEEALKLLRSFISMAARKTLKLDLVLVEEIIVTLMDGFPEFTSHLLPEDTCVLLEIAQDSDITPTVIPISKDGNRAGAPTPSEFVSTKPVDLPSTDIEMVDAPTEDSHIPIHGLEFGKIGVTNDTMMDIVREVSESETKTAHPESSCFKIHNLQYVLSQCPVVHSELDSRVSTTPVTGFPVKETKPRKKKKSTKKVC